jgi:uncharacterized protein YacL
MKMPCGITCLFALVVIVSKVIMMLSVANDPRIKQYEKQFTPELQVVYKRISKERLSIYTQGYTLGLILSVMFILYNTQIARRPMSAVSMVCLAITISFFVSYFYYSLSPKSDWVLNHVSGEKDVKAWLEVYRAMQWHYHGSFVVGLIGVGALAFAFRGSCSA